MGVTTTQTNKPFNPRGNDQSPLAFNRAKLFSGKALDFDGVNDYANVVYSNTIGSVWTWSSIIEADALSGYQAIFGGTFGANNGLIVLKNNQLNIYTNTDNLFSYILETGKKYHVALSQSGSSVSAFINGVLVDSVSLSVTLDAGGGSYYIGRNPYSAIEFFNGKMSGVKVYSTALTAAQVADLYNNPEKVVPTGVDNTALKLWLPMQEGAGTTAYDGAPDALGSEEVTNGDFATDSDWTKVQSIISNGKATITSPDGSYAGVYQNFLTIGKTYSYSIDVSAVTNGVAIFSGSSLSRLMTSPGNYKGTFVATNIRLEIKRNADDIMSAEIDNVSVKETSGFGTISGATWTNGIGAPVAQTAVINWNKVSDGTNEVLIPQGLTSGRDLLGNLFENVRKQGALNLDGNSWAEVHDNESLDFGSGSWTMECWVDWTPTSGKGIMSRWYSSERGMLLYTSSSIYVRLFTGTVGGAGDSDLISTSISDGWRHIVGTYDSSDTKLRIYIDGSLNATSAAISNAYNSNVNPLEIGRYNNEPLGTYTNDIAQPRIYNRALTAEEVQRNYNAGKNTYTN